MPDRDYLSCPESEIADTTSLLTMVGGKVVHGAGDFANLAPPPAAGHAGLVAGADLWRLWRLGERTAARPGDRLTPDRCRL